ncbi:MAG: ribonuclease P protein component [Actinomycetota bacterium]|nr:ribonuclease P protein component [Actinomycetota bacterium]
MKKEELGLRFDLAGASPNLLWLRKRHAPFEARKNLRASKGKYADVRFGRYCCSASQDGVFASVEAHGFRRAVDRNLAKRRAKGCLYDLRDFLKPGNLYIVICRPGSEAMDYQVLVNDIKKAISESERFGK